MKKVLILLVTVFAFYQLSKSQEYVSFWGTSADTTLQDETISKVINVNSAKNLQVSVQIDVDSVSGTPGGTATLYESLDGVNYITTGETETWVSGVDTSFILTDATFVGAYAKIEIVANSTTQKADYSGVLKASER